MLKTTTRGYGNEHQQMRRQLLSDFRDGDSCARCGQPMRVGEALDLDHTDDRSGYLGLSHRACNRRNKTSFTERDTPESKCPLCGKRKSPRSATCGRICGWTWRKRNQGEGASGSLQIHAAQTPAR